MAVKYQLSLSEFSCLVRIASVNAGQELQGKDRAEEEQMASFQDSLMKKGYIKKGEDQRMLVRTSLMELIQMIFMYEAKFSAIGIWKDGETQRFNFYFYEDRICFMEKRGEQYDLFEIPFLSLAAGMLANRIEIKGEASEIINQASPDEPMDELKLGIGREQIEKEWILIGENKTDNKTRCMFVIIEAADTQEMLELRPEKITVSKPGKIDFINACMDCMRKMNSTVR